MSAFLLGVGFRADMETCARKLVLLKLIDACDDDGTRIFPAISTIARAAQCSARTVQRELDGFRAIGLIRLVREGGKGPRSTNEYAMDIDLLHRLGREGWAAVRAGCAGHDAASGDADWQNKGDTVSPLEEAEKGDTGDSLRVTPATDKGDIACHPTPPDSSIDPSAARERGRDDREEGKKIEAAFWRVVKDWPGFAGMPKEPARKAWQRLSAEERALAEARLPGWLALLKAQGKSYTPSPSTYFGERLWSDVPDPAEAAKPVDFDAPAFGPHWSAVRLRLLLGEMVDASRWPKPGTFMAMLLAQDDAAGRTARMERQAAHGWPQVNRLHESADNRRGIRVAIGSPVEALAKLMEPVPVGSAMFEAWKIEHERRGWPWLPDTGSMRVVYFPAGGPGALDAFEAAIRGQEADKAEGRTGNGGSHDASGREAAE